VQNFLLKKGMDYFGKKDLIYIDMQGDADVARLYTKAYIPPPSEEAEEAEEEWKKEKKSL